MLALGATPEVAAAAATQAEAEDRAVEVWPQNEGAVKVFLSMGTQWRRAGMAGVPTGLDYAALPAVCRAHRQKLDAALLDAVGVIEVAALGTMLRKRPS
jgi:hypothetical protein